MGSTLQKAQQARDFARKAGSGASRAPTGLYDRSITQKEERERKLKALGLKMMEDCTFTPKTSKSFVSNRTVTTNESSGGESVFSRLYRNGGCATASWSSPVVKSDSPHHPPEPVNLEQADALSRTASTASALMSNRMEGTYHKHVQKMRARPLTEEDEKDLRDRNFEAKEMEQCTFRPKTHWGRQQQQLGKRVKRSTIVMEPAPSRARPKPSMIPTPGTLITPVQREEPSVPKEIVVMTFTMGELRLGRATHPWDTPPRLSGREGQGFGPRLLGPMREASLDSFEAIAARHTPQGKQPEEIFRERIERAAPPREEKQKRRRTRSHQAPDYGSI